MAILVCDECGEEVSGSNPLATFQRHQVGTGHKQKEAATPPPPAPPPDPPAPVAAVEVAPLVEVAPPVEVVPPDPPSAPPVEAAKPQEPKVAAAVEVVELAVEKVERVAAAPKWWEKSKK